MFFTQFRQNHFTALSAPPLYNLSTAQPPRTDIPPVLRTMPKPHQHKGRRLLGHPRMGHGKGVMKRKMAEAYPDKMDE